MQNGLVVTNVLCRRCGYSLFRLPATGACPECGKPVEESIRGDLLKFCDDSYLHRLERGALIVQCSLAFSLASMLIVLAATLTALALSGGGAAINPGTTGYMIVAATQSGTALVGLAIMLWGWWLFSSPDPGVHLTDRGDKPRRIVRAATLVMAGGGVLKLLGQLLVEVVPPGALTRPVLQAAGAPSVLDIMVRAFALVGWIGWVVQFFAGMRYIRWIAPRIPDAEIDKKAKTYTWLMPLLYIFGCGIGALVALFLYIALLGTIRVHVKAIRGEQRLLRALAEAQ